MQQKRSKISAGLQSLVEMQRHRDFELLGFHVAGTYYPNVVHTEFNRDAGEDGVFLDEDMMGRRWSLSCSLTGSLDKIRDDCLKLKKRGFTKVVLVFVAPTPIDQQTEIKWRAAIEKEFGFGLLTIGREKIISRLEKPKYNWISRDYLFLKYDPDFQDEKSQEVIKGPSVSFRNLPNRSYANLYGVTETLDAVYSKLAAGSGTWVVSLEGMGGIGKTTIADAVTRQALSNKLFSKLAWESFRNEDIGLRGASGLEVLVTSIASQLDLLALAMMPRTSQLSALQDELNHASYLVVVDNLETKEDLAILEPLLKIVAPAGSKIMLTTRYSLPSAGFVWAKQLKELSEEDSLAFLRGEAESRGLEEVARYQDRDLADIYELVGGNPLALNLVLGLLKYIPIAGVLQKLSEDRRGQVDEFYRFVYQKSWELLGEDERSILRLMVNFPLEGSVIERIEYMSGLPIYRVYDSLQRLMDMSLVTRNAGRYSIHRLTRSFVLRSLDSAVSGDGK